MKLYTIKEDNGFFFSFLFLFQTVFCKFSPKFCFASYCERTILNEYFVDIKISLLLFFFASFLFLLRSIDMRCVVGNIKEYVLGELVGKWFEGRRGECRRSWEFAG